jgi:hypothetical protein
VHSTDSALEQGFPRPCSRKGLATRRSDGNVCRVRILHELSGSRKHLPTSSHPDRHSIPRPDGKRLQAGSFTSSLDPAHICRLRLTPIGIPSHGQVENVCRPAPSRVLWIPQTSADFVSPRSAFHPTARWKTFAGSGSSRSSLHSQTSTELRFHHYRLAP